MANKLRDPGLRGVEIGVRGLACRFGEHAALDGLDLVAPRGRVTAVVGPSGAGKSTLLRVVAGLTRPDAGDVLFDGASVLGQAPEARRLGMVFQSYALFPHLTVADNVGFAPRMRGLGRRAARRATAELLERLEIGALAERHPHQLSGGERQRVALARALAAEPRALLLDEPLAALDARLRLALRDELARHLAAAGLTALYVTHDQEEAMALGHRVAVLRAGRLEQVGSPEELYRRPATPFVATFFGEANFLPVTGDPGAGRLAGAWGTLTVDPATAARLGESVAGESSAVRPGGRLMLRPEAFSLAAEGTGADLRGRVRDSLFLGGRRRLVVEADGVDEPLKVDLPATLQVAAGEAVGLVIDPSGAALWPQGMGGGGLTSPAEVGSAVAGNDVERNEAQHPADLDPDTATLDRKTGRATTVPLSTTLSSSTRTDP